MHSWNRFKIEMESSVHLTCINIDLTCDSNSDSSDAYEGEEPEVIELSDIDPSEKEKWVNDSWVSEF